MWLTLMSNASLEDHPQNNSNYFIVNMDPIVQLVGQWEIALYSISFLNGDKAKLRQSVGSSLDNDYELLHRRADFLEVAKDGTMTKRNSSATILVKEIDNFHQLPPGELLRRIFSKLMQWDQHAMAAKLSKLTVDRVLVSHHGLTYTPRIQLFETHALIHAATFYRTVTIDDPQPKLLFDKTVFSGLGVVRNVHQSATETQLGYRVTPVWHPILGCAWAAEEKVAGDDEHDKSLTTMYKADKTTETESLVDAKYIGLNAQQTWRVDLTDETAGLPEGFLRVYCSLVQSNRIGEKRFPVLADIENKSGSSTHLPINLAWKPVRAQSFEQVQVQIDHEFGKQFPAAGVVSIVCRLRERDPVVAAKRRREDID